MDLPAPLVDNPPAVGQGRKKPAHHFADRDSTLNPTEQPINAQTRLGCRQDAASEILPDAIESRGLRDPIRIASGDGDTP